MKIGKYKILYLSILVLASCNTPLEDVLSDKKENHTTSSTGIYDIQGDTDTDKSKNEIIPSNKKDINLSETEIKKLVPDRNNIISVTMSDTALSTDTDADTGTTKVSYVSPSRGMSAVLPKLNQLNNSNPFISYFESTIKDFDKPRQLSMSYNAAPLEDVTLAFSKLLGFSFYLDPAVKGTVTMNCNSVLTGTEVWVIFEQILLYAGAYASLDEGLVK